MKKDFIKCLIVFIIGCIFFMWIDNVFALTSNPVLINSTGTATEEYWRGNTMIKNQSFYTNYASFARQDFSLVSDTSQTQNFNYSYRLIWDLDGKYFKDYNAIIFTGGFNVGYVNTAQIFIRGDDFDYGYMSCTPISLPGTTTSQSAPQFSSFSCPYNPTLFEEGSSYRIFLQLYTVSNEIQYQTQAGKTMYLSKRAFFYNETDNDVVSAVKEQTDAINKQTESIDKVDDTLNDSDTTGSTDSAGGFFNGFDTEDNGGLSSLITSPLTFIRKATESCTALNLTMFDTNVPVPCGDTLFWNKPEVQSFRVIWNCIIGGSALFMILSKVFKVVENLKDPEHDKVEVMKL